MKTFALIASASAFTAIALTASAASAHTDVQLENMAARVVVTPENRADVELKVVYGKAQVPQIMVRTKGNTLVADGKLKGRGLNCKAGGVNINGLGQVASADLPTVYIKVPMDAKIAAGGATYGTVGASKSLEFSEGGCGSWQLASVSGKAEINIGGSGDVSLVNSADAAVNIGGSGNFTAQSVNALEVNIGGNGDLFVNKLNGPLEVNIGGSGNVKVDSGVATSMEVNIAGSGDVRFGGEAKSLEVNIVGSGDVRVKSVTGNISRSIMGSGKVIVGQW
ncbi:hypothetical protein AEAC466_12100 [Asticcacaulis sp. AC466]|uniref:GIN domain-containing protein n=1 Tax=Asticcacaulis sp. AC466 TaxID=1282362 RepID=UPI0003C3D1A6|nr:DUF2807 domain-containing protein [Asticcacaulis sp. AC466]ESQ83740.1 hypothetical protein AEAC466_12100 [Asticcacaulis sp. AC466]